MKNVLAVACLVMTVTSCVKVTPAGDRVRLLGAGDSAAVAGCRSLGQVKVPSVKALRNVAASLDGDTVLHQQTDSVAGVIVTGDIYACRPPAVAPEPSPLVAPPAAATGGSAAPATDRKAGICQTRGGRWTGTLCVIDIE